MMILNSPERGLQSPANTLNDTGEIIRAVRIFLKVVIVVEILIVEKGVECLIKGCLSAISIEILDLVPFE